jgi:hypothetical protein
MSKKIGSRNHHLLLLRFWPSTTVEGFVGICRSFPHFGQNFRSGVTSIPHDEQKTTVVIRLDLLLKRNIVM